MSIDEKVRVLFVCMGNICRSPTAHGVFRSLVQSRELNNMIEIDSAGTHAYHKGAPPDQRAQATAKERGVDLSDLRARTVKEKDFNEFDYILAMDEDNYSILIEQCPEDSRSKVQLFMHYAPHLNRREVPDPYYGGIKGFENVFAMIDEASKGLLADIEQRFMK